MEDLNLFMRLIELMQQQHTLMLFFILGLGYLIGNIRVGSFSLGPVAGVLFAGLFFGYFDFRITPGAQSVGFALFIFSVGYQAGPRFFDVLRTDGLKYFTLAAVIAATGFSVAVLATKLLSLAPGTSAGLLAGGLTSSPTLAAAQEAIRSGQVIPPGGITADEMIGNVATGYAITYIFGLAGLIAIIKLLPGLVGIDLKKQSTALESKSSENDEPIDRNYSTRAFRVIDEKATLLSANELKERFWDKTAVVRVVRDGKLLSGDYDGGHQFQMGDEIYILAGTRYFTDVLSEFATYCEEINPSVNLSDYMQPAQIVVINKDIIGMSPEDLNIPATYGVLIKSVVRMRMEMPHSPTLKIKKGDILNVVGSSQNIEKLGKKLGHVEKEIAETDMVTFCFGICFGVLIGLLAINVGQLSIGLGSAGGLLSAGLVIGYLRSVSPTFGRLPDAARWILMELGLLLFMAGVGLRAGGDIIETFMAAGPLLIIAGVMVTTIPILVGYFFGRKILKIHPVFLFGGICGSMTSGASLSVVTKEADSAMPSLGYTGAYAFANVLLTIAGSVILFF
ncbi:TrkA C-terminal domain-containing protein [Desulfogranum marinum]|uniref:aspartate:alanine exchanger family transporter n=1 Tax=Desulfogranum marinum TaxID=453220 RepID=UPI0029C8408E|nr:TrkA C-terminal domain-containing protein [Desulfogranum marinum]